MRFDKFSRREFLKRIGLGAVTLAAGGCGDLRLSRAASSANRGGAERPDVVVFLTDDLGYGDLGCYGHPFIKTPNLDNFAAEGMRLTDCYSASPICSPARAGLLTGRCSYRTGVYHLAGNRVHLRAQERTIAELLHDAGYATCFLGKWHLGSFDGRHPLPGDQGFDHWFATEVNSFSGPQNPKNFVRNGKPVGPTKGWYCDVVVDEAVDWLKKRRPYQPFFLEICTHEPHTPLDPPEEYRQMYDTPQVRALEKSLNFGRVPRYPEDNTPQEKRYYYATVTQLDSAFGRLMDALDEMGLAENTLVLFTSDNGPEYPGGSRGLDPLRRLCAGTPGNLRGMKRYLYEGGIRVPGIIRWPNRIEGGRVCAEPVSSVDFLPTLCELSGAPMPTDRIIDGVSITPVFEGKKLKRSRPLCWNINYTGVPNMAMRMGDEVLLGFAEEPAAGQRIMEWVSQKVDLASEKPAHLQSLIDQMNELWQEIQREGPTWPSAGGIKPAVGKFPRD
ncbi:MAG: sulfatase family protein [Planctomycetota bacterium]